MCLDEQRNPVAFWKTEEGSMTIGQAMRDMKIEVEPLSQLEARTLAKTFNFSWMDIHVGFMVGKDY